MAKDIKLYKDKTEITINEEYFDYYITLGYTTEKQEEKKKETNTYKSTIKKDNK